MFADLNPEQYRAVTDCDAPMLVLAGAGSGKTRVITYKIAWLIENLQVRPERIFAVTFTNKAAKEMQHRVTELLDGKNAKGVTVSTFHRLGMRIINEELEALDRKKGFSIFDAQDSVHIIRELLKVDLDDDGIVEKVKQRISSWKNQLISPEMCARESFTSPSDVAAARVYEEYQRYLQACNAVDLDDLLYLPNRLFDECVQVRHRWQARVQFLLVDEYQDTNAAQYQLVKTLVAAKDLSAINGAGLTVVGDDDQSIYAWRGAQPENLLRLQDDFPTLNLIKLQQNYRSAQRILLQANHVIKNNPRPFDKTLWSELGYGNPITIIAAKNDEREAEKVVANMMTHHYQNQTQYKDYAILYRGNHQARVIETKLREMHIPYYLSGGLSFFERSEIKDIMAYLRLLTNQKDDTAMVRVVNTPRRGVGASSLEALSKVAREHECSLYEAIASDAMHQYLNPSRQAKLRYFKDWFDSCIEQTKECQPTKILQELLDKIEYQAWLVKQSASQEQADARWKNVDEFIKWMHSMQEKNPEHTVSDIVAKMSLIGLLDKQEQETNDNMVSLMTLHAAKGLEFPFVFIVGLEEEILPHRNSIEMNTIEEERRLFYVGITRARQELTLSYAKQRSRYGEKIDCQPSRFLSELDAEHVEWADQRTYDPETIEQIEDAHLAAMRAVLG